MSVPDPAVLGPATARRRLGIELRRLREQARVSGNEVARALYWSPSKISRYEWAKTVPVPGEVDKLLGYFGVPGAQHHYLLQLAQAAHKTSWYDHYAADIDPHQREFIGLEHDAAAQFIWAPDMVPGLLQTEAYARQLIASHHRHIEPVPPGVARRRVAVTMMRQQILDRPSPSQIQVLLDEAALRRLAGDAQVMAGQLHQLTAERSGLTVRVLPLAAPRALFTSPFTLLRFDGGLLPDIVASSRLTGGELVEDERDTYVYWLAFQALADGALSPAASRALISKAADGAARPLAAAHHG
jgi:transcriptional regulator with XRE-family HTH domain